MPSEIPDVTVLLVQRLGAPDARELAAWEEAVSSFAGSATIAHVWAGSGAVPAGMDLGTPAAATDVLGLDDDAIVVVAEASAVPGPHLVARLVEEAQSATDGVIDARVLPFEVTLTDYRERGYALVEGTDAEAAVLKEERLSVEGDDEDDEDDEDDAQADERAKDGRARAEVDHAVAGRGVRANDGQAVHPRVTGACCAVRARHLLPLAHALVAEPSETSGATLVAAARDHDLDVDVATAAAVHLPLRLGWDARPAGRVPSWSQREVEWPGTTHPAALPASSLGRVVEQFDLPLPAVDGQRLGDDAPFLSIVTRTQGARLHCLEDMFTCLAGQNERDFEVLVMAHRVDEEHLGKVGDVVASLPSWLREKVRVIPVERSGRAAPLNDGFAAARGHYIAALDDDDTVLAHYVATYKRAAVARYGRLLRVVAVRQDIAPVGNLDTLCAVSVDDPFREWPMDFALVAHLSANYSPFMSVAFPRGAMHALGLRFDETLDTTEDWDYIVRCAASLGVESVREVTCVYRWWVHTGSSREVHSKAEWDEARLRVERRFTEATLMLQSNAVEQLVESLRSTQRAANRSHRLARKYSTMLHETNLQMIELNNTYKAAVRQLQKVEARRNELRDQLRETRDKLQRRTRRVNLLEARVTVEERLRRGTLEAPDGQVADLPLEQLQALAQSPEKRSLRSRLRR